MRRKDREMDKDFAFKVIDDSDFGVLGLCKDEPYTIPLSIVRKKETLYFHSAPEGKKVRFIDDGDLVSVTFVSYVKVPENYSREEVKKLLKKENMQK